MITILVVIILKNPNKTSNNIKAENYNYCHKIKMSNKKNHFGNLKKV